MPNVSVIKMISDINLNHTHLKKIFPNGVAIVRIHLPEGATPHEWSDFPFAKFLCFQF